ncbi:type II secretion system F family protein [Kocuria sp. CPCC 205292]|uniref:type II secretion system F family protein n=1 Tax=Kocuria cellulosilytica TaxID=3071451 RepID=UPI0034D5192B
MSTTAVLPLALCLCLAGGAAALLAGPVHRVRSVARAHAGAVPTVPWQARFRRDAAAEAAEWIALLRRLAALLQAGRSPAAAFDGAGPAGDRGPRTGTGRHLETLCASVAAAARLGLGVSTALAAVPAPALGHRPLERRAAATTAELCLCWEVSERTGAPLAALLGGLADALEAELDAEAARGTALAGPRSTVRILTWLPVLGIGLGMLMGVDPLRTLLTTPWGLAALVAGAVLTGLGRVWTRTLIGRAEAVGAR